MYAGAPVEYGTVDDVFERAGHPYTQALIAAVPRLGDERATTLAVDPGRAPARGRDSRPGADSLRVVASRGDREVCVTQRPAFAHR